MHDGQLATPPDLVRRLVDAQFPRWADLPLTPVRSDGTAHAMYRLGEALAVRLPLLPTPDAAAQLEKDHAWLPRLAPHLPLPVPIPAALGAPTGDYPSPWTVCRWLPGAAVTLDRFGDDVAAARDLAAFVRALRACDTDGAPPPGPHNFLRGAPLAERDDHVRTALPQCKGLIDGEAAERAWTEDSAAPPHDGPPVWIHGDLAPGNLLARDGRLAGVIDWGGAAAGDPATDLLPAWNLFTGDARAAYRDGLAVDEPSWLRGRALALAMAVIALPYYRDTNRAVVAWAQRLADEVLADR